MKTIYNIYERMYNGILAGMDDTLRAGDVAVKNVYNSPKEKLIRIIVAASHMTDRETILLRSLFNDVMKYGNQAICFLPKKLQSSLIVASNRKLKLKDFEGFSVNTKESDFRCSIEHLYIETASGYAFDRETIDAIKSNKDSFYQINNKVRAIQLGNALIYQYNEIIYMIIDDTYRLVMRITNNQSINNVDLN